MTGKRPSETRKRSCRRCVELKVKCSPSQDDERCHRCSRLGHECTFPERPTRRRPTKSRIDRLQERVDELLAQNGAGCTRATSTATSGVSGTINLDNINDSIAGGLITIDRADTLLEKFRSFRMPQFPFVVVPATTRASQLHAQSPFLLLTIIAACLEDDLSLQKGLDHEIKRQISIRIIINNERSMDLLLGLLVHTAWYHYRFKTIHTLMYLSLELAITLVADLGLDQNSGLTMRGITAGLKGKGSETRNPQSSTEKRALLGVFHLTSVLSLFRPQLLMRYTDWINQCCADLSENPEYPTDRLLRTYLDGSAPIIKNDSIFGSNANEIDWNAVEHQQDKLKKGNTGPHDMIIDNWAYYFEVKAKPILLLGEILHHQSSTFTIDQMSKLDDLIHSTEDFIASFPRIPADRIVHLPLPFHTYMWYALLILSKTLLLSNMDHPKTLNLEASICGNIVATLNRMEALSTGQDIWANSRNVVGSMLSWLKDHMRQKTTDAQPARGLADSSSGQLGHCPASTHSIGELQLDDIPEEAYWNADWWQQMVEGPLFYPAVGSPSWLLPATLWPEQSTISPQQQASQPTPSTSPDAVTRQHQLVSSLVRSVYPGYGACLVAMSSYDRGLLQRLPVRIGLNDSIHHPRWDALTHQVGRFRPFTLSYLLSFPNELILEVADHLDLPDLARLSRVNRHLRELLLPRVFRIGSRESRRHKKTVCFTWLHYAAFTCNIPLAQRLMAEGSDPYRVGRKRCWSPLYVAVLNGYAEMAEVLGLNKADTKQTFLNADVTLLHAAVESRNEYLIMRCLQIGLPLDVQDVRGDTPLHHAAANGDVDVVRFLCRLGACIHVRNFSGATPMHRAASARISRRRPDTRVRTIVFLYQHGAVVDVRNIQGQTPSMFATARGHLDLLKQLFLLGARADVQDNGGRTLLHEAVVSGEISSRNLRMKIMTYLCSRGSKVDAPNSLGDTPLHFAAIRGFPEAIRRLVELGARRDSQNALGQTPLHAALAGDPAVIRLLVALGVDINAADFDGMTPLHQAMFEDSEAAALELIRLGANVHLCNADGRVPASLPSYPSTFSIHIIAFNMNYVADPIPADLLPIPPISSGTSLPEPIDKPIKILMIHGHGSSSSRIFYKYRALQPSIRHEILQTLHRDVEFYFPNAPLLPTGFEPGMWTWGLGDYRVDRVPGLQESISYLVRYMEEHGPFDGIVGSSAGASIAVLVGSLLERRKLREEGCEEVGMVTTHPPFKFILAYSGFQMSHPCYKTIYRPKIRTPVLLFIGDLDTYIPGPLTLQLARRCVNHRVVYFPGVHYIPRQRVTTMAAAEFICDCLGEGEGVFGKGDASGRLSHGQSYSYSYSQGGDEWVGDAEMEEEDDDDDEDGEWEWVGDNEDWDGDGDGNEGWGFRLL
ncbi:uncharacterized protein KD926_002805 [Aspergillus affinis]|uniref:uncharacterized protein n=1 Tax=Aspergillus affinis TaxID=1070780 RepID=UPI0022FE7093|nr:uncharacterized protein KD926_002805 [Aspergillus affinis]KAI9035873.1 hypothetical protein KD926_002805 [Aspergillus affinis]